MIPSSLGRFKDGDDELALGLFPNATSPAFYAAIAIAPGPSETERGGEPESLHTNRDWDQLMGVFPNTA